MKIEYLLHAPRTGEPYGTIYVRWSNDAPGEAYRIIRMLDNLSSWGGHGLLQNSSESLWWEICCEDWYACLAILSFSGGTEIQRW